MKKLMFLTAVLFSVCTRAAELSPSQFVNPPIEARVGAYWVWLNGNVDHAQLTHELEEMKVKGMSGAEIWDIGVLDRNPDMTVPAGPAFLGPESLAAIRHVDKEATRLGLNLGLISSSSWNEGGSWVEPKDSVKVLYVSTTNFTGPAKVTRSLPFPSNRAVKGADGLPLYHREVAVLAFPASAQKGIPGLASVLNLSDKMNAAGELQWDVPPGEWIVLRLVCATTGQQLVVPSPNSRGLMVDHMDAGAETRNYENIFKRLFSDGKPLPALKFFQEDSIEINPPQKTGGVADWTDSFPTEFKQRRGYDLIPYLPVLAGQKFAAPQLVDRFLHDYRETVSDLWMDKHYLVAKKLLHERGLQIAGEPGHGGHPRPEVLRALGAMDIPRGEFWNTRKNWVTKEAASAAHIYGLKYADAESFTGWRSWQDGPFELKRLADTAFCDGMNRMTIHNFAHNPPSAGLPGYCYHAGEHVNVNTTWWPKSAPFFAYLDRCCYMLQQGLPVADACFYYGDDAPNLVAARRIDTNSKRVDGDTCLHCFHTNPAPANVLGDGYDYDVVNSEVILKRMTVKNGRLSLPDGVSYAALVLPNRDDMPLTVLKQIESFVRDGAIVLGPKPVHASGLTGYPNCDTEIQSLAGRLWGNCDGQQVRERAHGKGLIVWDRNRIREILQQHQIIPDFAFHRADKAVGLDYIHRRTATADIYFISNENLNEVATECVFRVTGKQPHFWLPDTGEIKKCESFEYGTNSTRVTVKLPPGGSIFVVFDGKPEAAQQQQPLAALPAGAPVEITGSWLVKFPPNLGAPASKTFEKLVSWTDTADEGVKYFSGTATYCKDFAAPADALVAGRRVILDLGSLRNVADVTLNGQHLGILWKPPFQVDVTSALRADTNQLQIDVVNVWANRIVGDAKLPKAQRVTQMAQKLPVQGPHESGLLGPVWLRFEAAARTARTH